MELRHLKYFVVVAEERNFTRAANRLNMAQPPLSQAIRKLEKDVGGALFLRNSRHVELTPAGRVFLEHARAVLAELETGTRNTQRAITGEAGEIRLGFTGTSTFDLMPFVARAYVARHPDVTLHIQGDLSTREVNSLFIEEKLDIAIAWNGARVPGIEYRTLRTEPLVAVLPESHSLGAQHTIALSSLAPDNFISYTSPENSEMYDLLIAACAEAGFIPSIKLEATETSSLVSLVAAGLGVAVVPASARFLRIPGAMYRPIEECSAEATLNIAWHSAEQSPAVLLALKTIRQLVKNLVVPFAGAPLFNQIA